MSGASSEDHWTSNKELLCLKVPEMQLSHLISVKYGALLLLVLQNTLLVVAMRYSRVSEGPMYAASTAVFLMEAVKFVCCNFVVLFQSGGVTKYISEMSKECTWLELAKLSVPAFLYTVQNNLLYFALSNLDATTYQVCYQSKILTTAVFSVLLLKKGLSRMQWLSLVILTIGVSITQISSTEVRASFMLWLARFLLLLKELRKH